MYDYIKRRDDTASAADHSASSASFVLHRIEPRRIFDWLLKGAHDFLSSRGRSLLFGACYVAIGHAIAHAHARDGLMVDGFISGFLFLGPLLAVGTYELSRQCRRGEPADLVIALFAFCRNPRELCLHALLLCVVLTVWLHWSSALLAEVEPGAAEGSLSVLIPGFRWATWFSFAVVAFMTSVVAVPMLLDRPVRAMTAVRTSLACCLANPLTMGVWALTIAAVIGLSLWLNFWPLLVTGPWIGHATWHVYRDCVGTLTDDQGQKPTDPSD